MPSAAAVRLPRSASSPPLYRQVCDAIEQIAMDVPLGDESALPAEGELMARFGVSRGTLRRATDELARQGLLRIEPGKGTFVIQPTKVRLLVWERLAGVAKPDSRFDLDLSRFVPDFDGRERCDDRLLHLEVFAASDTIFVTPDNSLESFRCQALAGGKRLVVPTYGMRRGFVLLEGQRIPRGSHELAATLDGMERLGAQLTLEELRKVGRIGLVVTGAVAVTRQGLHFGAGDGYFDLEWGLLRHCGLVTSQTTVAVSVHDLQVLDTSMRPRAHDAVVDVIITPDRARYCIPPLAKPDGIFWHEIRGGFADAGPYIRELVSQQQSAAWTMRTSDPTSRDEDTE